MKHVFFRHHIRAVNPIVSRAGLWDFKLAVGFEVEPNFKFYGKKVQMQVEMHQHGYLPHKNVNSEIRY